jgi:type IV pilus assembly protein PilV
MVKSASAHCQSGITLIEVLVAALVLAIGLLGLASLQGISVKFNHTALLRTHATTLAYQIADAMRANAAEAQAGDYDGQYSGASCPTVSATSPVADVDVAVWCERIADQLPSGEGTIAVAADGVATVTLRWYEADEGDEAEEGEGEGEEGEEEISRTAISFQTRL